MSEEGQAESQGAETEAPQTVPLYEATDEQLDAFLESRLGNGSEGSPLPNEVKPNESQPAEAPKEQAQGDGKGQPLTKDEWQERAKIAEERLAKVQEQVAQQEQFIQRRNTEFGKERQAKKELLKALDLEIDDEVNPRKIQELLDERKKVEEEEKRLAAQQQQENKQHHSRKLVMNVLGNTELDLQGIESVLKADGVPENIIANFRNNPFASAEAETIIQLAKRSHERAVANNLIKVMRTMHVELERLKSNNPDAVAKNLEKAFNSSPPIEKGGSSASIASQNLNPSRMSDAELDAFLASQGVA